MRKREKKSNIFIGILVLKSLLAHISVKMNYAF